MKLDEKLMAEKMIGLEPIFDGTIDSKTSVDLIKCLNWYSYMSDEAMCNKWISDYMKKHSFEKQKINHVISYSYNSLKKTLSTLCRMSNNGTKFIGEVETAIDDRINQILSYAVKLIEEKTTTNNVVSIQDRILNIATNHFFYLDDIIDSWYFNKKSTIEFDMYGYLQREQLSTHICKHIKGHILTSYLNEFQELMAGGCEQLEEAYAYISKSRKKQILQTLKLCIDDLDRYVGNTKSARPKVTRKKKPISVEKQINTLKYQREFSPLKIKSVNPQGIVGAQQLWIYNTKYDQLTVFNALGSSGFSIKGTTLQNYDESSSIKKKIRKPKDILPRVLDGGKIVLKKLMDEIKTKPIDVNGRLNDDTIILRIIR